MTTREEQTFLHIMERYGHDVLVLHHNRDTPCNCQYGELFSAQSENIGRLLGSVDRHCPYCFGMGYIPTIKKYRTRVVDGSVSDTVPRSGNVQNFGAMTIENKHFYFHKDVPIKEQDLIIEVDWDGIMPVYNNRGVFEVSHVHPFRYERGEVLYFKAAVKDQPVNKNIRGLNIAKKAGEIVYLLEEGK